jgi:hypothetical protein
MRHSKSVLALAALLALNVVLAVLLTPLGFESRPPTDLTNVGYLAIGTVFAGLMLDLLAIILLIRGRTRLASILAIAGSILFVFPNVVDRTGFFFTLPIPPVIDILEYVFMAVLLVTLFVASTVYREGKNSGS